MFVLPELGALLCLTGVEFNRVDVIIICSSVASEFQIIITVFCNLHLRFLEECKLKDF